MVELKQKNATNRHVCLYIFKLLLTPPSHSRYTPENDLLKKCPSFLKINQRNACDYFIIFICIILIKIFKFLNINENYLYIDL